MSKGAALPRSSRELQKIITAQTSNSQKTFEFEYEKTPSTIKLSNKRARVQSFDGLERVIRAGDVCWHNRVSR